MVSDERKSILLITLSNIGDVILTTPVIGSLRRAFPQARMTVVVGPRAAELLQGSREIDCLLVYDKGGGWSHKLKLIRGLREEFYDFVVDLRNSAFPYLVRANRRSPIFRIHQSKHARERHLEILRFMRIPIQDSVVFDFFSKEEERSVSEKLKVKGLDFSQDYAVVAPGARSQEKRWRIEGFRDVLTRLLEKPSLAIVLVGEVEEGPLGEALVRVNPKRVSSLIGETTLRELAALVARAKLVLTHDSAVMHLGYELLRPVVAIFGPTDPEKYGRQNEIWRIVREIPPRSLEELSSEKVFQACEGLLRG